MALGPLLAPPNATTTAIVTTSVWRTLSLPNFSGAGLHGYLDGTMAAPTKTIVEGTGDAAVTVANPAYAAWWTQDQRVLGLLLSSMDEDIAFQMIGRTTATAVWEAVHAMFGAQNRANIRHIRQQIQSMRKNDMTAHEYMNKVKVLTHTMVAAGSPLKDDEVIDYMITGLGSDFNPLAASMIRDNRADSLADVYSHVLSFESLCAGQTQTDDWSSSANAVSRPGSFPTAGQPSQQRPYDNNPGRPGTGQGGGGDRRQNNGGNNNYGGSGNNNRSNDNYGGGDCRRYNGGGNGRNSRKKQRPQCQLCNYWGHDASDCRNRFNPESAPPCQRSGNSASTSSNDSNWHMDTGATDHLPAISSASTWPNDTAERITCK
ncbi:uncharacterized protein [Lolium perenne]|uniref:uncharacterized protein n=1 Tax=Lolium perenne TaxID=4522 RepID=UPI003A9A0C7C